MLAMPMWKWKKVKKIMTRKPEWSETVAEGNLSVTFLMGWGMT
jgi:hypothetical protein